MDLDDEGNLCVRRCLEFKAKLVERIRQDHNGHVPKALVEIPLVIHLKELNQTIFSTADLLLLPGVGNVAYLVDWKTGRAMPPETALTLQLMAYALMLMRVYPQYTFVKAYAYYPRLDKTFEAQFVDPDRLEARYVEVIRACEAVDAPLVPGEEQCKYCRASSFCPAVKRDLIRIDGNKQYPTVQQMTEALEFAEIAKSVSQRITATAKAMLSAGIPIENDQYRWQFKTRRGNRLIKDPINAYGRLNDVISSDEFVSCMKVRISQLEKLWTEKRKDKYGNAKSCIEELALRLGEFCEHDKDVVVIEKVKKQEVITHGSPVRSES